MKKLLTILALALVLCLSMSAALATSWDQLNKTQKDAITSALTKAGIASSEGIEIKDGKWSLGDAAGTVVDCEKETGASHSEATYYSYVDEDGNAQKSASEPADLYTHYGDVKLVTYCSVCNKTIKTQVVKGKVDHNFGDPVYSTVKKDDEVPTTGIVPKAGVKSWTCYAAKDSTLYKYEECSVCGYVQRSVEVEKAAGKHAYADKVTVEATCKNFGWQYSICTVCGAYEFDDDGDIIETKLPKKDHDYSEKEYCTDIKDLAPTCKNGLTATYVLKCKYGCGTYEGNKTSADFEKNGHTETVTVEKAAKLNGWVEKTYGPDNVKNISEDGHYYSKEVKSGAGEYSCQPGYVWVLACETCGEKLTITTAEDKPDFEDAKTGKITYTDCTHATVELLCNGCEGKAGAAHKKTETKEFKETDALAHGNAAWIEDLSKHVDATCATKGSQTLVCSECGYIKTVETPKDYDNHKYSEQYTKKSDGVWETKCLICGDVKVKVAEKDPTATHLVFDKTVAGTCLEQTYDLYKYVDKDGKDVDANKDGKVDTEKVFKGFGDHLMVAVPSFHKAATCTEKGQDLMICARCTTYNPDNKDAKIFADYFTGKNGNPCYELVETDKIAHTWDKGVVDEKTGDTVYTCTVCGEKKTEAAELKDTEYTATVKFDKETSALTGKASVVAGTEVPEVAYARVTYFMADGTYTVVISIIDEEGNFESMNTGNVIHVAVQIIDSNKVVPGTFESFGGVDVDVK